MRSRLILASLILGLVGCDRATPPPSTPVWIAPIKRLPGGKLAVGSALPAKPLTLAEPAAPASDYQGQDLSRADGGELAGEAHRLASDGKHPREAALFEYWAVKAGAGTHYNLACYTALAGNVEAAFYWLQEAAIGEGVDAEWAGNDPDLASLRADRRWNQVAAFLKASNDHWKTSGIVQTVVVLPRGYQVGTPIGVVVAMHGMGADAEGFVDPEGFQPFADELNMAFVAVSGTVPKGRGSFVWSEDPKLDAAHVKKVLDSLSDRLTIRPGHLVAMGFSQGGQLGFEVAFQNPDDYRGAIVMSPGTPDSFFRFRRLAPTEKNKGQGYVCLAGEGEHGGNIAFARQDAKYAQEAGARAVVRITKGQQGHSFPPDFATMIVRWVKFVDGTEDKP